MGERVNVLVSFENGRVKPIRFWRGEREYVVRSVPLSFERSDGGRKYLCFSVVADGMMAELILDRQNFQFTIFNLQSNSNF